MENHRRILEYFFKYTYQHKICMYCISCSIFTGYHIFRGQLCNYRQRLKKKHSRFPQRIGHLMKRKFSLKFLVAYYTFSPNTKTNSSGFSPSIIGMSYSKVLKGFFEAVFGGIHLESKTCVSLEFCFNFNFWTISLWNEELVYWRIAPGGCPASWINLQPLWS